MRIISEEQYAADVARIREIAQIPVAERVAYMDELIELVDAIHEAYPVLHQRRLELFRAEVAALCDLTLQGVTGDVTGVY